MKRLSPTQQCVLAELTSGTGNHLRWEDMKGHLRVYTSGGLRQVGEPVKRQTLWALMARGLVSVGRLPSGAPAWHPTAEAWALAHKGELR